MLEKINLFYFIISFCIGIILVNIIKPKPEIIMKFPTKYNIDSTVYEDKSGNCFKYTAEEKECPSDKTLIKDHPIEPFSSNNLHKAQPASTNYDIKEHYSNLISKAEVDKNNPNVNKKNEDINPVKKN
jgi:hypothetical protein